MISSPARNRNSARLISPEATSLRFRHAGFAEPKATPPGDPPGFTRPQPSSALGDPRVKLYWSTDSQPEGCGSIELQE